MFPRQLLTHKEVLRAALGVLTAAAANHYLLKNNENNAEGLPTPTNATRTNPIVNTSIPPQIPDFFRIQRYKTSITNFAHCESSSSLSDVTTSRIGACSYPANNPVEDRHIFGQFDQWTYSAVFDGHGGPQVAEMASKQLLTKIVNKINNIDYNNEILLDEKITAAFNDMEQSIVDAIKTPFHAGWGEVAKVGSCVLFALKRGRKLVIANCGDCRAVMGSTGQIVYDHKIADRCYPTRINRDHNCRVRLEQDNLQKNHPNEPNLIVCKNEHACYVKGRLQLTRSLGDAYLKYAEFNGNPVLGKSGGRYIPDPYTPPYVSHQPDIHHINLEKEDRFLILGTDGLWDYLPAQEAVDIVFYGMKNNIAETEVAKKLVERALEIAASESGMSLQDLRQLPPGRSRRSRHDDTTAVVMYF